ncbi:MAG: sigma-54-dependent Fis family transcriptional regulator [Myxococcales bacterium]|nr:sigma-54-dependent Fis family transcriptional regulator [Myxococcales bacterium]MCB9643431.1 sigma-54-dependent Fis family transcriptional regulator [Myxococcales bacterium]
MPKDKERHARVLVVDDEESIRHFLTLSLQREGFEVKVAGHAEEALSLLPDFAADIVLCDIRMPGEMDGLGLLRHLCQQRFPGRMVMMSAYGSRDAALEAVRQGAYDYIEKPIQRDELLLLLEKLLERERLQKENRAMREVLRRGREDGGIVASSSVMQRVLDVARKVSSFPTTVLLQGESGTGKEVLARAIHQWSPRNNGPWTVINCGSIPEALLESELFGYGKGAFTGALHDRLGLFEAAHGGTLFLDEIGEMPLALQVKLLRALQEGAIRRLGETSTRAIDVRVIAATNRDLSQEVEAGRFRQDLFYRLHVVNLTLPPLRDRLEDLPLLLDHFLAFFNARFGTHIEGVSPDTLKGLMHYHWPGNVRELRNVIERSMVLAEGDWLGLETLPPEILAGPVHEEALQEGYSLKKAMRRLEENFIQRALEKTEGNKTAAAKLLEISPRALLYKIKDYGLE